MLIGGRRVNTLAFLFLFSSPVLPGAPPAPAIPPFNRDIAPILFGNCSVCHCPLGAGPFSLLTYGDARKHRSTGASQGSPEDLPPKPVFDDGGNSENQT